MKWDFLGRRIFQNILSIKILETNLSLWAIKEFWLIRKCLDLSIEQKICIVASKGRWIFPTKSFLFWCIQTLLKLVETMTIIPRRSLDLKAELWQMNIFGRPRYSKCTAIIPLKYIYCYWLSTHWNISTSRSFKFHLNDKSFFFHLNWMI